jgi:hypothetical protein
MDLLLNPYMDNNPITSTKPVTPRAGGCSVGIEMILDGMALWGEQGLSREQIEARIAAVPLMLDALRTVLYADPEDDEAMQECADKIVGALNRAGA